MGASDGISVHTKWQVDSMSLTYPRPPVVSTDLAGSPNPIRPKRIAPRVVALVGVALLVTIIIASNVPASVVAARQLAYPVPAVAIGIGTTSTVHVGDTVQFDAHVRSGNSLTYSWDFGDDSSGATGPTTSHVYNQYGKYTVTLRSSDPVGQVASASVTVLVLPTAPTAYFSVQQTSDPFTFDFDASGSSGTELQYHWDFGDNNTTYDSAQVEHAYSQLGSFRVVLTVVDAAGQTASHSQTVQVAIAGPVASFTSSQDYFSSTCFTFDASNSSGYELQFSWDFGDGNTSSGSQVSDCYSYGTNASYRVTLTVTDGVGRTNSTSQTVTVSGF